jgi:transcriptional regulator with XRE-family HTH domain
MMAAATRRRRVERPEPAVNTFGDYLREVMRTYECESVAELVRLLGVDQSSVSRYLTGQNEPTLANLRKIAEAQGASLGAVMVAGGIATREELGMVIPATPPQRLATALRAAQDFLDHPDSSKQTKQWLVQMVRGLVDMCIERRDGVPSEPGAAERRRGR